MMSEYNRYILANICAIYWLNIDSILHQYSCATRGARMSHRKCKHGCLTLTGNWNVPAKLKTQRVI